ALASPSKARSPRCRASPTRQPSILLTLRKAVCGAFALSVAGQPQLRRRPGNLYEVATSAPKAPMAQRFAAGRPGHAQAREGGPRALLDVNVILLREQFAR